jgi:hypothetical protein
VVWYLDNKKEMIDPKDICVLVSYNEHYSDMANLTVNHNIKQYCEKHGYTLWIDQQNELDNNRHTCHYCNTDILEIRQLINDGVISGRAVSKSGLSGPNLEIDRKDPFALYDHQNCVLSCYYCNNDKSNTFSYEIYKKIFGSRRRESWVELINKAFK